MNEALQAILVIAGSAIFGTAILVLLDAAWEGFSKRRHRSKMTRMPKRIRRINTVC